jgi:hypothetical protein
MTSVVRFLGKLEQCRLDVHHTADENTEMHFNANKGTLEELETEPILDKTAAYKTNIDRMQTNRPPALLRS